MSYQKIQVEPLSPVIGAEISGVDLSKTLDEATFQEIHAALMKHPVVFFRDQDITLDGHTAFGRWFGDLHIHPAAPKDSEHPEILIVHGDDKVTFVAGSVWHSDVSCDVEPPMGSILRIVQVPSSGGDTLFASMYAAFEALSDRMQRLLSGLTVVHEGEQYYRGRYGGANLRDGSYPIAEHPAVRTHPVTGRQALYVNEGFTTRIKELNPAGKRCSARLSVQTLRVARVPMPLPLAHKLHGLLGQPVHPALGHLGLLARNATWLSAHHPKAPGRSTIRTSERQRPQSTNNATSGFITFGTPGIPVMRPLLQATAEQADANDRDRHAHGRDEVSSRCPPWPCRGSKSSRRTRWTNLFAQGVKPYLAV